MGCRIEARKTMLIERGRSITDIEPEVAYKSQSYFTERCAVPAGMIAGHFVAPTELQISVNQASY
jgi:AraC-like DNA-binding protein